MSTLKRVSTLILILSAIASQSRADTWTDRVREKLLSNCEKQDHAAFASEFDRLYRQVLKQDWKPERDLYVKVVFPDALPKGTLMKGWFLECSDTRDAFLAAKDEAGIRKLRDEWIECEGIDRGERLNPIRDRLVQCLKKLKL